MKSGKILLFSLALVVISNAFDIPFSYAQSITLPTGQESFPLFGPITSPIINTDPSQAMPIGVGPVASGGDSTNVQLGIAQFSGPVDLFFGVFAPAIDPNIYILTFNNTLQPLSAGLTPWKSNVSSGINVSLFGNIPISSLPSGTYTFYLAVTPAGRLDSYYLWTTAIDIEENVLPITVNGSLCSANSYPNKPCVSVRVCTPGTSTCQTINDILLDSGSTGLRIFKQALSVSLLQEAVGSGSLAECVQYGDGSSDWGPVQTASLILGNEPPVEVPIQVIDSTFGTLPVACLNADQSPAAAGFNGVLGVGLFIQDCGPICSNSADNGMYYACSGAQCSGTTVPLSGQVQNPVALLPQDNNGVIVQLPSVPLSGSPSVDGKLLLGIGTRSNNAPSAVTTYAADEFGDFIATFNGVPYSSFIDSGTNGLFFPSPSASLLPDCVFPNWAWFCPLSAVNLSATNTGASGSPSGVISFQIGNFVNLLNSANNVFPDIGGKSFVDFAWGLPFFLGRNVYIGLAGRGSSLGSGPFWAY